MNNGIIIHLYVNSYCGNKCPLCCNNKYDIDNLPVITVEQLKKATTLCLTGGDPFFYNGINSFVNRLRRQYSNINYIYAYTSGSALFLNKNNYKEQIENLDGINVCPKTKNDWKFFTSWIDKIEMNELNNKSNRLYVFDDQYANYEKYSKVIDFESFGFNIIGRKWDDKFTTPDNEIFVRLPILLD